MYVISAIEQSRRSRVDFVIHSCTGFHGAISSAEWLTVSYVYNVIALVDHV